MAYGSRSGFSDAGSTLGAGFFIIGIRGSVYLDYVDLICTLVVAIAPEWMRLWIRIMQGWEAARTGCRKYQIHNLSRCHALHNLHEKQVFS